MIRLDQLGQIPNAITIPVIAVLTACLLIGIPLARRAGRKAAGLAKTNTTVTTAAIRDRGKDRIAMFAALAPSVLVWLAVMGVSFIGLTGFAADFMQWWHWTNMLVPLSLDGISVSFGGWAFVAVKRGRHPGRSYRIVLAAATLSATLNFVHGRQVWSIWAGIYLAFLSLAGMAMFHEMLDQFMANYDEEITRNAPYPRFGQRWLWAPITTFKARRAWIVYPPHEGTRPTINNALDHWRAVRRMSRAQRIDGEPPATPWLAESHNSTSALVQAGFQNRDTPASPLAPNGEIHESVNGGDGTQADIADARNTTTSPLGSSDEKPETPASPSAATAENRMPRRAGGRPASNSEVNAAAEQLWIDHKRQGTELTGGQLLELFERQYPHYRRRLRWAAHRRKAAQARYTENRANMRDNELDGQAPPHLDNTRPLDPQPQPTAEPSRT